MGKRNLLGQIFVGILFWGITQYSSAQSTTSLRGTVKSTDGVLLPGVNIILKNTNFGTVTNFDGYYEIKGIREGSYTLQASYLGYESYTSDIDINTSKTTQFSFTLTEKSYQINDIEVSGKSVVSQINEQAYSVTSVSTKDLFNSTANVKEVLNKVPGVRISEEGGMGSNVNFTINGFSGDQVKFFMDGLPMDNFGSSLSFADIPVNMIERIDVYKGVVPVWLGTDALGGAVNIITNKKQNFLDLSYSYGSFNTHKASVNFAHTNNGFTLRGNAFINYSDNNYKVWVPITNENNTIIDTAEVERFHDRYRSGTIKLEAGVVDKNYADNLLLGLMASANDKQVQHGATMATVYGGIMQNSHSLIPTFRYSKQNLFTQGLDVSLYSAFNIKQSEVIDTLRGIRYNWLGEAFKTEGSNNGENSRTFTTLDDKEFLSQFNSSYAINPLHSVALNYAYTYFDREAFDEENPDYLPNQFDQSLNKQVVGVAYKLDANEKWSTTAFAKLFHLNAKTSKLFDFGLDTQRTEAVESNKTNVGYGLASAYFILPKLQLKLSYEHTYRMPTPMEIFGDGLFIDPNPDIGPEQSDNLNLGADYRFKTGQDHSFNTGATFVYREAKDLIYSVVQLASPVTYYDNLNQTRTLGIESNLQYQYKDFFHMGANVTFQDITDQAEYIYDNSYAGGGWKKNFHYKYRVPNIPYLFGSANAGFNLKDIVSKGDDFNINYFFNYVENYYLSWSTHPKYIIPQQTSHDLMISYAFDNGKYNISAECRNLTNARLYDKYYLQKPGRSFAIKLRYTL
nr:TonB-dependent receptor [uncultured Carboxylicivirga sp.]